LFKYLRFVVDIHRSKKAKIIICTYVAKNLQSKRAKEELEDARNIVRQLGKCTGNPRVSRLLPAPAPVATRTRQPTGFLIKMSPRTWKMVEK
jgi:hypothetical protein